MCDVCHYIKLCKWPIWKGKQRFFTLRQSIHVVVDARTRFSDLDFHEKKVPIKLRLMLIKALTKDEPEKRSLCGSCEGIKADFSTRTTWFMESLWILISQLPFRVENLFRNALCNSLSDRLVKLALDSQRTTKLIPHDGWELVIYETLFVFSSFLTSRKKSRGRERRVWNGRRSRITKCYVNGRSRWSLLHNPLQCSPENAKDHQWQKQRKERVQDKRSKVMSLRRLNESFNSTRHSSDKG